MSRLAVLPLILVCAFSALAQATGAPKITQGSLIAYGKGGTDRGDCPLKNTSVTAEIAGFIARVRVRQEFENPFSEAIEAIYTFPLSHNGAVDEMTMTVGTRTIRGKIMPREDARSVYEAAKADGKTASLLDQQRPNIFTQAIANIMPGEKVVVEISYVEMLKYEEGSYEFVFPMTVGPRYSPASVKDAAKVKPPYVSDRPGHDISIDVRLNAGVPIEHVYSPSHRVQQANFSSSSSRVTLRNGRTIPNKDFILSYDVSGEKLQDAVLAHRGERGGFFALVLQPPDKIGIEDRTPKEIVFVLDTSGSMSGFPIEKAKEAMRLSMEGLHPDDSFNFITFAGDTKILFAAPVPATHSNVGQALEFLETRSGAGGTEMMTAVKAALDPSDSQNHLRIVCFMTDGFVANEAEIIAEVQRHPNARVHTFGIGSSVNRYLLEKLAQAGRGEAEFIGLNDDGSKAARKFYERLRTPLLTDISIDWTGLPVTDVYPSRLSDLFSSKPLIIQGRYTADFNGRARLRGKLAGQEYVREIAINLPEKEPSNNALATLWARARIEELSMEKLRPENSSNSSSFDKQIMDVGLEFGLMTAFTSFVAVEEKVVNYNGVPTKVEVPAAMPEGVSANNPFRRMEVMANLQRQPSVPSGSSGQRPGAFAYGAPAGKAKVAPKASPGSMVQSASIGSNFRSAAPPAAAPGAIRNKLPPVAPRDAYEPATLSPVMAVTGASRSAPAIDPAKNATSSAASGAQNGFWVEIADLSGSRFVRGRALQVVEPKFTDAAKVSKPGDEIEVAIDINPDGFVDAANSTTGPESLRTIAVEAASRSKFARIYENGKPLRTTATLVYRIASGKPEIVLRNVKTAPLTEEDERWIRRGEKLHHLLYRILVFPKRMTFELEEPYPLFVEGDMAFVRIELQSPMSSIAPLAALGFILESRDGKIVKGRLPTATVVELGDIAEVKYASPLY